MLVLSRVCGYMQGLVSDVRAFYAQNPVSQEFRISNFACCSDYQLYLALNNLYKVKGRISCFWKIIFLLGGF
jgi:hypothetical protein